jgi:hypothetical protein
MELGEERKEEKMSNVNVKKKTYVCINSGKKLWAKRELEEPERRGRRGKMDNEGN